MRPEHLALLRVPGRPSVHPSGSWAAVAISRPDLEHDAYRSQLWRFALSGAPGDDDAPGREPVQLTHGPSDREPVISPDGQWIAFLRAETGGAPQLAVLRVVGGEPIILTGHPLGVRGRPAWSPDSGRLAYLAPVPEHGRYGTVDGVGADAEPPRLIRTFAYRQDGEGFTLDRPAHVHVLDVPSAPLATDGAEEAPAPARVTDGHASHAGLVWTPDGSGVLTSRRRDDSLRADLVRVAVPEHLPAQSAGFAAESVAAPESVTGPEAAAGQLGEPAPTVEAPVTAVQVEVIATGAEAPDGGLRAAVDAVEFAPALQPEDGAGPDEEDGDVVYLLARDLGEDDGDFIAAHGVLYRGVLRGAELTEVAPLTDPEADDLGGGTGAGALEVSASGVLLVREHRGSAELVLVCDVDGGVPSVAGRSVIKVLTPRGTAVIGAQSLPAPGDGAPQSTPETGVVVTAVLPESPGEVLLVGDGLVVGLSDLAAPLRAEAQVADSRELGATAPDGYPVHGWLALPDASVHGPGPYPVLLSVHGGPFAQYHSAFFDEVQVWTGAGYAVVYGNPRGSQGYGRQHGRAIIGAFGDVDADDVLALLDHALAAEPSLDSERTAVVGGSYGGYMAAWLTTQSQRFTTAIVERGFLDPLSFEGSSDIGWYFGLRYLGEEADALAAQNPMAHIGAVRTPTLVVHSEQDWRCPVEQGQRWYVGLRRRGVPAELLLFPGEGHELSRSGRPKHRLARFEHMLDWLGRHLTPTTGP